MRSKLALLVLAATLGAIAQNGSANKAGPVTTQQASGTFDVKVNPLPAYDSAAGTPLARMSIDKQFHGALEATSIGEMLAVGTGAPGSSGGYVAMERVTGKLAARSGSFVLQHSATMTRGTPQLSVTVVPDSGTGELAGLAGAMTIKIEGGKHFYQFDYRLEPSRP